MVLSLLLGALAGAARAAASVAVVMGAESPRFAAAAEEAAACLAQGTAETFRLEAGPYAAPEVMGRVRRLRPRVIAAAGARAAAETAKAFPRLPLVYFQVVYPERLGLDRREDSYGVAWLPDAASVGWTLRMVLPASCRVGAIVSVPAAGRRLEEGFAKSGVSLSLVRIAETGELPDALRELHKRGVTALWLGADPMLADPLNFEIIRDHALRNRLPLVAPFDLSPDSLALAGVSVPARASGKAACRVISELLAGERPPALTVLDGAELSLDLDVARRIGYQVPEAAVKAASKVLGAK